MGQGSVTCMSIHLDVWLQRASPASETAFDQCQSGVDDRRGVHWEAVPGPIPLILTPLHHPGLISRHPTPHQIVCLPSFDPDTLC